MKSINFQIATFLLVGIWLLPTPANGQVQCLKDAWKDYNDAVAALSAQHNQTATTKFEAAIQSCNLCITQFAVDARKMQAELKKCPPVGAVSEQDKREIFSHWALNDVATAAFIKGKSAEFLMGIDSQKHKGRNKDFQDAKVLVKELSYGRCWDIQGWFWSPCKALSGESCCP